MKIVHSRTLYTKFMFFEQRTRFFLLFLKSELFISLLQKMNLLDFSKKTLSWRRRQRRRDHLTVTRLKTENPRNMEGFAIRLLARSTKGITSFQELRTTKDQHGQETLHQTFTDAAKVYHFSFLTGENLNFRHEVF